MPRKKRGRKKSIKLKLRPDTVKSIFSITLIVAAFLTLLSFFATGPVVNARINDLLRKSFGFTSIIFPFILLVWGLVYFRLKNRFTEIKMLFGLLALQLSTAGIFHIFYPTTDKAIEIAQRGMGGGFVGYQIGQILRNTVGAIGGFIILSAIAIISLIMMFDLPFDEMLNRAKTLKEKLPSLRKGKKSEEESSQIEVMSGVAGASPVAGASQQELPIQELPEPSFEIVPSLAEPQSEKATESRASTGSTELTTLAGLPYSDKMWENPPVDLLNNPSPVQVNTKLTEERKKTIKDTLDSFGITVTVIDADVGPTVTRYILEAEQGTKVTKIASLQYDLALALASPTGSVRIEAPIPGQSYIGVEVPNADRATVTFKEVLVSDQMKNEKSSLSIVLGKDVGGTPMVYSISKMPHLLVAGATGSGKSVFLHSLMFSLLYKRSPDEVKFILVDPKRVELVHYQDIPHLYSPVVTDIEKAASVFKWAVDEMERRYKLFESAKARNIESYNEKSGFQALPYIVIIVDELGEIMVADPASVEKSIIRLAQLARATGIHLVLTTQRPSTNVVTGLIKANIPCRIAFNVTSNTDSRVIIDQPGAEKLTGKGDMLFVPPDAAKPTRIQGTFVTEEEISRLVNYLKNFGIKPDYKEEILSPPEPEKSIIAGGDSTDEYFEDAVDIVVSADKASASLLQRRLSIGYARAARILDELEAKGVVGPAQGSKPRDVLISQEPENPLGDFDDEDPFTRSAPNAPSLD